MIELYALLLPRPAVEILDVLRTLEGAGIVEGPPAPDPKHGEHAPSDADYDALRGLFVDRVEDLHLYARWVAPAAWPEALQNGAREACGALLGSSDPRAPFDPLEVIVPIHGADPTGAARARGFAGHEAVPVGGLEGVQMLVKSPEAPILFEHVAELRVLDAMLPFAAWAVAKLGLGPVYVVPIEI
ncbi:MAG: hypothetical protein RMA76_18635 [Deltaproteobacteria bacterium]